MMGIANSSIRSKSRGWYRREHVGWNSPHVDAISGRSSVLQAFGTVPRAHGRSGLRAFDMVPGAGFNFESPSLTGGGSIGYNSYNRDETRKP
jgi:hypothetical protein